MPPRPDDATLTGAPLNPAEANMGQISNGSNKRPREEEDDLDEEEDEEGGKKERSFPLSHQWDSSWQDEKLRLLLSRTSHAGT